MLRLGKDSFTPPVVSPSLSSPPQSIDSKTTRGPSASRRAEPEISLDGILSCGLYKTFCLTISAFCLKSIPIHGQILDFLSFSFLLLNRKRSLSEET